MRKILSAAQIRAADQHTIEHEPIASIDLMERASNAFVDCFEQLIPQTKSIAIVCGPGNNGGDAYAIARLLKRAGYRVSCYDVSKGEYSEDCRINRERLLQYHDVQQLGDKSTLDEQVIVDGIFGSGLTRPVSEGLFADAIDVINASEGQKVSIDIPSGLFSDGPGHDKVVEADHTISFQVPKLSFLLPETGGYVGELHIVNIGLDEVFIASQESDNFLINGEVVSSLLGKRGKFSHKGNYGRVQVAAGSHGKMGAAYLCGKACMRVGAGLLTMNIPFAGNDIIQTSLPEAMTLPGKGEHYLSEIEVLDKTDVFCLGPGMGTAPETKQAFQQFLGGAEGKRMVLDADALNIIGEDKSLINAIPRGAILTPHAIEFERVFRANENSLKKFELMRSFSQKTGVIVVSKGAHSVVSDEEGKLYFNTSGNAGMATAGSGDVLAGMITGLLAQGLKSRDAAIAGVYLHGMAGDVARKKVGEMSLMASDLLDTLPEAISNVNKKEII